MPRGYVTLAAVAHDQSRVALAAELDELLVYMHVLSNRWDTKTSELDHMPRIFVPSTPPTKTKLAWCIKKDICEVCYHASMHENVKQ